MDRIMILKILPISSDKESASSETSGKEEDHSGESESDESESDESESDESDSEDDCYHDPDESLARLFDGTADDTNLRHDNRLMSAAAVYRGFPDDSDYFDSDDSINSDDDGDNWDGIIAGMLSYLSIW